MKKICYLIPYFGKLPEFFDMWLYTAGFNSTIDFKIFTNDSYLGTIPNNVEIINMSFDNLKLKIQNMFDFTISLTRPYKLCDFRPAYGEIFSEYLIGYDFWGHCDLDLIWGDIRSYFLEDILNNYDKIGYLGHSTIYKNTVEVNKRYRLPIKGVEQYRNILSNDKNLFFDENSINQIYEEYGFKMLRFEGMADISALHYNFFLGHHGPEQHKRKQVLFWKSGKLFIRYIDNDSIHEDECMYAHFLQREMKYEIDCIGASEFCIVPNRIFRKKWKSLTVEDIKKHSKKRRLLYYYVLFKKKWKVATPKRVFISVRERIKGTIKEKYKN